MRCLLSLLLWCSVALYSVPAHAGGPQMLILVAGLGDIDYGFENSLEGWTASGSYSFTTTADTGTYSISLFGDPASITRSLTYNSGAWTFRLQPVSTATCQYTTNGGSSWSTISATGSVWNTVSVPLTAGTSTLGVRHSGSGTCLFDSFRIP